MLEVIDRLVHTRLIPTWEFITQFFEVESGFINTWHPDFINAATDSIVNSTWWDDKRQISTDSASPELWNLPKREWNEVDLIK